MRRLSNYPEMTLSFNSWLYSQLVKLFDSVSPHTSSSLPGTGSILQGVENHQQAACLAPNYRHEKLQLRHKRKLCNNYLFLYILATNPPTETVSHKSFIPAPQYIIKVLPPQVTRGKYMKPACMVTTYMATFHSMKAFY